jgi:hypothetical protein
MEDLPMAREACMADPVRITADGGAQKGGLGNVICDARAAQQHLAFSIRNRHAAGNPRRSPIHKGQSYTAGVGKFNQTERMTVRTEGAVFHHYYNSREARIGKL